MIKLSCVTLFLFLCCNVLSQVITDGEKVQPSDILVGGVSPVPVDDPEVINLAKLVTAKLSEGDKKERTVIEILEASRQVVSGLKTILKLKISDGDQERIYRADIWEQSWLNRTEITKLEPVDGDDDS